MDIGLVSIIIVAFLLVTLLLGFWIGFALVGAAWLILYFFTSAPPAALVASTFFGSLESWPLAALPLFIWMGDILGRSRLSADLFRGLAPWLQWIPGRLLHINVFACGIFAAVSGSSAATTLTVGRIALPELERLGYDQSKAVASLAGSGTLGLIIPPSIPMIVYGIAAGVSVTQVFIAGILPGLLLVALFSGYLVIWALLNPGAMPARMERMPFLAKIKATSGMFPILALIAAVIGSLYTGLATPTEAAALGVVGALTVLAFSGGLTWATVVESLTSAARMTSMIGIIIAGAGCFGVALGFVGVPRAFSSWVAVLELSTFGLLVALTLLYVVLGCFLEGVSIILLTLPILLPVIKTAGIDPLWFGIYLIILIEIAQLTPPVGFNLFVIQALTKKSIGYIVRATIPMIFILLIAVTMIALVPSIVTWLPRTLR